MPYTRGTPKKIIVGAAAVFTAPEATALPTLAAGTSKNTLQDATDWENVGFTSEGIELSYEPDFGDVEVDQLLDSARLFRQSMRVMVNTSFAEATLENLIIVWGQANETLAADVLSIVGGDLGDYPVERALAFVGPAPFTDVAPSARRERVYYLARAIQTESTSHALRRNEPTMLPVSFRVLPDAATSNAQYGRIQDRAV